MVITRAREDELRKEKAQKYSNDTSDDDVAKLVPKEDEEEHLGRGCRQRKSTVFYEPETESSRKVKQTEEMAIRHPPRAAALRAERRLQGLEKSGSSSDEPPSPRPRRQTTRRKNGTNMSPEDDEQLSNLSDDSSKSTDTSQGVLGSSVEREVESAMKKKTSINSIMERTLRSTAGKPGSHKRQRSPTSHDNNDEDQGPDAATLGDITPLQVDPSTTFASVGGLAQHILTLREMVLIPLLYPNLVQQLHLRTPRGVLFIGPPGTGKTLMARALANEGTMSNNGIKITFFMRKGADILSKWVGESEKQLRLLFDEAKRRQPSIVFFDEIDGLAPVRHSKQEQSHAALVSTLLALMDGMDDRGQVVVLGATNRPDTIDPALRRPGRFDRELRFPLPDEPARRRIAAIHMGGECPSDALEYLVRNSEGWSGADIQAACTEAKLVALRRSLPQIYVTSQRLQVDPLTVRITAEDYEIAVARLIPSVQRSTAANHMATSEHSTILCRQWRDELLGQIVRKWGPAACVLTEQKRKGESLVDLRAAAMEMTRLPSAPSSYALFLVIEGPTRLCAEAVADSLTRSFPTFHRQVIVMPNIGCISHAHASNDDDDDAPFSRGGSESFLQALDSTRACAPSILILQGLTTWLRGCSDEDVAMLQFNLCTLMHCDVLVVVPVKDHTTIQNELTAPESPVDHDGRHVDTLDPTGVFPRHCLMRNTFLRFSVSRQVPSEDRRAFFHFLLSRLVNSDAARIVNPEQWPCLPEDTTPLPKPKVSSEAAKEKWEYIVYKRGQLRHILRNWLMQFINVRFQVFYNADLDLDHTTPNSPQEDENSELKRWRQHTRGTRIGLVDLLEKLDHDEYCCLSQYNEDIDMLCHNVTSFFRGRDARSMKYRSRANQLREATILNNHKIHKHLVAFLESVKDEIEPDSDSDEDANEDVQEGTARCVRPTRRRKNHYFGSASHRKKVPVKQNEKVLAEGDKDENDEQQPTEVPPATPPNPLPATANHDGAASAAVSSASHNNDDAGCVADVEMANAIEEFVALSKEASFNLLDACYVRSVTATNMMRIDIPDAVDAHGRMEHANKIIFAVRSILTDLMSEAARNVNAE